MYLAEKTKRQVHYVWVNDLEARTRLSQTLLGFHYMLSYRSIIKVNRYETANTFLRQSDSSINR
jgi:hypothetical protein